MYVKGNPVLSKMYAHSGLTLNERGLYFFIKDDSRYNFMITEDHVKIAEIMGFDYVEFEGAKEYNDFFELLLTNQFFRPSVFLVDGCNGEVRMFKELSEFLSVRKVFKGYTKRSLEDMFEPLKEFDFEARYKRFLELKDNVIGIGRKFNGGTVLKFVPDFDKRNLERGFMIFNERFSSYVDKTDFIFGHSEKEIVEEFVRLRDNY